MKLICYGCQSRIRFFHFRKWIVANASLRYLLPHVDGLPARQASFGAYREEY